MTVKDGAVKIAINGFGRIGRLVLRAMIESERTDVVPVLINDLGSVEDNAHLLRYDSVHGRFPGTVEVVGDSLVITHAGRTYAPIKVSAERDPAKVPLAGVDVAMECTGLFTKRESAAALLTAGARKVVVSAPADGVDATIVFGVNHKTLTKELSLIHILLCVSTLPVWSFKNFKIPTENVLPLLLGVVVFAAILFADPYAAGALLGLAYIVMLPFSLRSYRSLAAQAEARRAEAEAAAHSANSAGTPAA